MSVRDKCTVFPDGRHVFTLDAASEPSMDLFCCVCGEQVTEFQDSGTGA